MLPLFRGCFLRSCLWVYSVRGLPCHKHLEPFFGAPDGAAFNFLTKEGSMEIAKHNRTDLDDDVLNGKLKAGVNLSLFEIGVLQTHTGVSVAEQLGVSSQSPVKQKGLQFEQEENLLPLQLEVESARPRMLRESTAHGLGAVRNNSEPSSNLGYVPQFNERDRDTARGWPDAKRIGLIQCMLKDREGARGVFYCLCEGQFDI